VLHVAYQSDNYFCEAYILLSFTLIYFTTRFPLYSRVLTELSVGRVCIYTAYSQLIPLIHDSHSSSLTNLINSENHIRNTTPLRRNKQLISFFRRIFIYNPSNQSLFPSLYNSKCLLIIQNTYTNFGFHCTTNASDLWRQRTFLAFSLHNYVHCW
jgi:hypothetical protein